VTDRFDRFDRSRPPNRAAACSTVVVIRFSDWWFRTATTALNSLGILVAVLGMLLFRWVGR
jgi:hypothetical protein